MLRSALTGISRVDWRSLRHAYGAAGDVPRLLWRLTSPDLDERDETLHDLVGALCHQGSLYEATVAAIPFLVRLASTDGAGGAEAASFLGALVVTARQSPRSPVDDDVEAALLDELPTLRDAAWSLGGTEIRREALAALLSTFAGEQPPETPALQRPSFWSLGVADQAPRPLARGDLDEIVATVGPGDFRAQVDALLLGNELVEPTVGAYESALRLYAFVEDDRLRAKNEFGRLFALEKLGRVDDAWRRDARALVDGWLRRGDDRLAPYRHLNPYAVAHLATILGDEGAQRAIEQTPPPVVYELSPWGTWMVRVNPSMAELLDDL